MMKTMLVSILSVAFTIAQAGDAQQPKPPHPVPPSSGGFLCTAGPPTGAVAAVSWQETAPVNNLGGTYVDSPPHTAGMDPSKIHIYCSVAGNWCAGNTCNQHPKLDFATDGAKLLWSRTGNYGSIRFVAIGRNLDRNTPQPIMLSLVMPPLHKRK